ncbi:MAG: lysylphosphatidylglycerol synthase transmembrane domain-containing protein [Prevotella sp.]|nr:lysylphosphatidylglycerol synthase transmembrane domain-containing protein [Prevotella sp.]
MKKKYQNAFFLFGIAVFAVMLTNLNLHEVLAGISWAGYWFFAVVLLWVFLYALNTTAWYLIIKSQMQHDRSNKSHVPFLWLYKITVSGFALNYATPGGLMGGEPYRIMELAPRIGTERASSSVILYAMTHIFSHFWFWMLSALLYVITQPLSLGMSLLLALIVAFCSLAVWFFLSGYKKGLAVRGMNLLSHFPWAGKWARRFIDNHRERLQTIDNQIAALHGQNPRVFLAVVMLELLCRVCSAFEIYFVLLVLYTHVSFVNSVLILAFTSLFANMLFFMPLQLGGREGGFYMSVTKLGMTPSAAVFVALIVRLRELVWTGIGLLLIKVTKRK